MLIVTTCCWRHFIEIIQVRKLLKQIYHVSNRMNSQYHNQEFKFYLDGSMKYIVSLNSYAKEHGIKNINATRGGNLEIFLVSIR